MFKNYLKLNRSKPGSKEKQKPGIPTTLSRDESANTIRIDRHNPGRRAFHKAGFGNS